jgi:hypothetical protein
MVITAILIPAEDTLLPHTPGVIRGSIQILQVAAVFIIPLQDHIHREVTDPPDLLDQGSLLLHIPLLPHHIQAVAVAAVTVAAAATDNLI